MLGSPILDVAIGMAFIYLLLSLIASAIQELLSSLVATRSANLYNGIRSLLSGDTTLVRMLYEHGLIAGLYRNPTQDFAGLGGSYFKNLRIALQPFVGLRRMAAPGNEPTSDPLLLPAYIPARTFALALMDLLNEQKASGGDVMRSIRETLGSATAAGKVYTAIEALALDAGNDERAFQANLENWYNDSMDRVAGWYKHHVGNVLLVLGLLLSLSFNVDSIRIAKTLWFNPDLRQSLSTAAGDYLKNDASAKSANGNPAAAQSMEGNLRSTVNTFNNVSSSLTLPVGWRHTPPEYIDTLTHHFTWDLARTILQAAIGWILTACALSFGAPFWFDTLNRFMIVRSTVKPQEKSQPEVSKN